MDSINSKIEQHYTQPQLYTEIINRLQKQGVDLQKVSRKNISTVDEFHVRGAEATQEIAREANLNNITVLDVGCGIGGTARLLAEEYHCTVTGIDLTEEYINTAQALSKLLGLENQLEFLQADALDLPFKGESFDAVFTEHVQMNIENKTKFYSEIHRVLSTNGTFVFYDVFKISNNLNFPVPFAEDASISFLSALSEVESLLKNLGFVKVSSKNLTKQGAGFFEKVLAKINATGPPILGLNVLMGKNAKVKISNMLEGLKSGAIRLESGIYKKE